MLTEIGIAVPCVLPTKSPVIGTLLIVALLISKLRLLTPMTALFVITVVLVLLFAPVTATVPEEQCFRFVYSRLTLFVAIVLLLPIILLSRSVPLL